MSTYQELKGLKIKYLSSDTSGDRIQEGEVFYNSSDFNLKSFVATAAWHSSSPLVTARYNQASGSTPTTAGVTFGGFVTPGPGPAHADTNVTEEYDGTGWASGGNMNTARSQFNGFGTQTTAVGAGGYINGSGDTALVEEYNGSTWTEVTNIPAARRGQAGFGTLTAGVIVAGVPNSNATLEYDGTNWTAGNNIGTGMDRTGGAGAGILTAGIVASGDTTESFTYDGTNWTDVGTTNSPHDGGHDTGVQTAAVITSGFPPPGSGVVTATELYDGTSFTTSATVATGRYGASRGGASGTTAFIAGGDVNPGTQSITEEFNITVNTVTQGAWASGGNLNTGRKRGSAGGTQTAALFAGGFTSPPNARKAEVEEYNGSAWSEVTNMPTEIDFAGYGGTQTAQVTFGGNAGPGIRNATLEYDGTNWTATNNMGTARYRIGGAGTQTAALGFGGYLGAPFNPAGGSGTTATEEYDGSSWTAGGAMSSPRNYQRSCSGIQTNAIAMGGGAPYIDDTEKYNGSSWSASEDYIFGNAGYIASNGTSADDLRVFSKGGFSTHSATYNGTSYTTAPFLATGRHNGGTSGSGPSSTSTYFGGHLPGSPKNSNATEEFTGETTAVNLKTITDS